MRAGRALSSLLLYTSFTSAWPWPPSIRDLHGLLVRRQDGGNQSSSSLSLLVTGTAEPTAAASQSAAVTTGDSSAPASNSAQPTDLASASGTAAGTSAAASASITSPPEKISGGKSDRPTRTTRRATFIDPRLPAGGIEMMTPGPNDPTSYYKIGEEVTFGWNYTSLSITPSAIDVLVSCTSATYTIKSNMTVQETGIIKWNTSEDMFGADALGTDFYTLVVHDSQQPITAVPQAGHLGSYSTFRFGMYLRRKYEDLPDYPCATCSGALSAMERQTFTFLFAMLGITIFSFSWFAGNFLCL